MAFPKRRYLSLFIRIAIGLGTIVGIFIAYLFIDYPRVTPNIQYGVTWSSEYAKQLGISSQAGLQAVLDDLHIRNVRLPVYWSDVETAPGVYDWTELDQELDLLASRHANVILSIGMKVPRWPECWIPTWAKNMSAADRQTVLQQYLMELVTHEAHRPEIQAWQVENEVIFPFGICPSLSISNVKNEIQLVRTTDKAVTGASRPIYTTDSGEFSPWIGFDRDIDGLGVSVYQVTDSSLLGIRKYFIIPPWFYEHKAWLISPLQKYVYVSELQMEPWTQSAIQNTALSTQFQTFDLAQMIHNLWFIQHAGFTHVDMWGAEWWYWMKTTQNHPEFWNTIKEQVKAGQS